MWTTALIIISTASVMLLIVSGFYAARHKSRLEAEKRKTDELLQNNQRIKYRIDELEMEIRQLTGIVSHDLKVPFNRIFALIHLIQRSSDNLQPEQQVYLSKIHIVIADGLGLIRNLADKQKLEGKGIDLTFEPVNLSTVLGLLTRNYKGISEIKNIHLHLQMQPDLMVHTDKHYLYRILENVLSNAIKFSPENKNVFVNTIENESHIIVEVRDEGPGMSEEDQRRLYRTFQPLTTRPTGGETSTGIGLAVAKAIADKLEAGLYCVSELERGTTFTLTIIKEKSNQLKR